jgi:hypothetical protein
MAVRCRGGALGLPLQTWVGVPDLGRRVPDPPSLLPFVLREIGGVAMAGQFRVRQVPIRHLFFPSALGRQASPPWPNSGYLVLELPQPRRQYSRATSLGTSRPIYGRRCALI